MAATVIAVAQLVMLAAAVGHSNCALNAPPGDAGETQVHGVILYLYPRNISIDKKYNGCQNHWFNDEGNYRKLSVTHFIRGMIYAYDSINPHGDIAYHCQYMKEQVDNGNDRRCPPYEKLKSKSYPSGCLSRSKTDRSGNYKTVSENCVLE